MALHNTNPASLGMRSGNDDMKLVTTVTLHWREGGNVICWRRREAEEGQWLMAASQASVVWHWPLPHHACLVGSHMIKDDWEGRQWFRLQVVGRRGAGQLLIVQLQTITITVCLVDGWRINNNLEWRRTAILLAQEEERSKQRRPCRGPVQKMEPHQIARSRRPMRAQRSQHRRGGMALFGWLIKATAIYRWWLDTTATAVNDGYWWQLSKTAIDNWQHEDGNGAKAAMSQRWLSTMAINNGYRQQLLMMAWGQQTSSCEMEHGARMATAQGRWWRKDGDGGGWLSTAAIIYGQSTMAINNGHRRRVS